MRWRRRALVLGAVFGGLQAHGQARRAGCPTVLVGEVFSGQRFAEAFDGGLQLTLEPEARGWVIRVLPAQASATMDFAEVATPPFRSINPLLLTTDYGFRAQDVIGWNPRTFHYVADAAQFRRARRAEEAVLGTSHPSPAETSAVAAVVAGSKEARLEVLDARVVPGSGDQSSAAALLATHFSSTAHTLANAAGGGTLGRVEWIRFRATLGGVRERWNTAACNARR